MELSSRVVLVTAGGSGIGLAIAHHFYNQGDRVHICDIDQSTIDSAACEMPDVTSTCADLTAVSYTHLTLPTNREV